MAICVLPTRRNLRERDDVIRLDCVWDRSLRPNNLEPSYVLWADGSNDEMCFAVIMSYQKN